MLNTIKQEINEFTNESIEVVEGFTFNQRDTLQQIYLYYNSRYQSGDIDDQGDKKYFYNINRNPCNVGTKAIDFDTKHIKLQTAGGGNPLKTWFFERDLKFWFKDQNFGKTLNRIFQELPIFGSVVLKIINGKPYFVDLRNFIVEQSADDLGKANYIIEIHNYTPVEFRRIGKQKGWNNVEEAIAEHRESGEEPFIKVYERYGEVEEDDGKEITYPYKRVILADVGKDVEENGQIYPHTGLILDEGEIEKPPYKEFHWEKIPGRWLGVGRVEILFDPQIRTNEISNQQVKSSYWSTLRLWQTRDEGVNRNLLTDVENGEVLNVESEISQVDMADRNLAYYSQEINRWMVNRDELTFARDVLRGERMPAGVTLGAVQIAAGQAGAYFDQIRENVASDIKQLLYDVIIPQFEKENNMEHHLRLVGEDLDKYNTLLINQRAQNNSFELIKKTSHIPYKEERELLKMIISETVRQGKEKLIKIAKGFYQNLRYKIDIIITGEALDTRVRAANLFAALQAVTADPSLLTDPNKRKFFFPWLEQGGLNPTDFEPEVTPPSLETLPGRAGGGISRPVIPATPVAGRREATV